MRLILFFDLPVITKSERKAYSDFHKYLIKNGYIMLQFSVYCKIFNNIEALENHKKILKKNIPNSGHIRVMNVTEKQYVGIEIIIGGRSLQEDKVNSDPLLIL